MSNYKRGYKKGQKDMLANVIGYIVVLSFYTWFAVEILEKIMG